MPKKHLKNTKNMTLIGVGLSIYFLLFPLDHNEMWSHQKSNLSVYLVLHIYQ